MSWIPLYADNTDFQLIIDKLNSDAEIAIILPSGRSKWRANTEVAELADGKYSLWHIPSGSLPLLSPKHFRADIIIEDPFVGWTEKRAGADPSVPFLGSATGIIELQKVSWGVEFSDSIGISSFGWIGNRYRPIGAGASKSTGIWWRRLQRWVRKVAIKKIPRWDSVDGPSPEIWVFPSAHEKIQRGAFRDANPPNTWPGRAT